MKIVRHVARDMRQAMRAIRERLGEDAVILSSRRVAEGVEVTAAVDFDAAHLSSQALPPAAQIAAPAVQTAAARNEAGAYHNGAVTYREETPAFRDEPRSGRDDSLLIRREVRAALLEPAAQQTLASPDPAIERAAAERIAVEAAAARTRTAPASVEIPTMRAESPSAVISLTHPVAAPAPAALAAPFRDAPPIASVANAAAAVAAAAATVAVAPQGRVSAPPAVRLTPQAGRVDVVAMMADAYESSPPATHDAVGSELKTLRRMLETQLAQLAWNEMTRRAPIHTETLRELSEIGIAHDLASHITEQLPQDADLTYARRFAIAALSQYLNVTGDLWLENGARIAFIGATGVGKTTTLAKLAVRWVLRHGPRDLALVAADGTRLGAQDQMQSLGQLLGVPVYTPEHFETLPALLERLQQRFILIDTPGSSMRDTQLGARLSVLANSASQLQTALVLSASTQAGALEEAVKRFAPANPCCCVLTKLDEAASLGGALSVLIRARIPISYVSEGQRIPEDLRPARALELVSNAVRLAKASGAAADEDLLRRRFGKVAHAIT